MQDNEAKRDKKSFFLRNIILISFVLLISLITFFLFVFSADEGKYVKVELDGELVGYYSLENDAEYSLNGGTNILIIENGFAYMDYAGCPDKTCVKRGKINSVGQSIICLPNKLSVTVISEDGTGVDIVS